MEAGDGDAFSFDRDGHSLPVCGEPGQRLTRGSTLAFTPRDLLPLDPALRRRNRSVELVDAVQQVAELEAPEHLVQARAVGRREHELVRGPVELEITP